jgi:MSHA biogenesis protein MshM
MYQSHFGLRSLPFTITPDTGFFHNAGTHQEALNVLLVALRTGEGFIKVTGEVGTGKTLLCRQLLNSLEEEFVTAYIPNPFLTPTALRMALAEELGIQFARNLGQHRLLKLIRERLVELSGAGKRVVLLLDEAQALPDDSLEALRLLTNLETEHAKLLQVVLFGQPELDRRLAQDHLRQLRQRILFSHQLQPLDGAALAAYLMHRLRVAGYQGEDLFTPRALRQLLQASRGIPRLVNVLCHKALLVAYGRGDRRIDHRHLQRAVADTEDAGPLPRRPGRLARWLSAALLAGLAAGTAWGFKP